MFLFLFFVTSFYSPVVIKLILKCFCFVSIQFFEFVFADDLTVRSIHNAYIIKEKRIMIKTIILLICEEIRSSKCLPWESL